MVVIQIVVSKNWVRAPSLSLSKETISLRDQIENGTRSVSVENGPWVGDNQLSDCYYFASRISIL